MPGGQRPSLRQAALGQPPRQHGADACAGVEHPLVGLQTQRQRLAQRPRRQQPAVADAAVVEDQQLGAAGQAVVLQAVVGHQHIDLGMCRAQRQRRRAAIAAHPHRHGAATVQQQRFVADLLRRAVGPHRLHIQLHALVHALTLALTHARTATAVAP